MSCDSVSVSSAFLHFVVHDRIEEAHALHVGQLDAPHAVGAPHVQLLDVDRRLFAGRDCCCFSTPMMAPVIVPGWAALACCNTTSTFSPRAWFSTWPKVGLRTG